MTIYEGLAHIYDEYMSDYDYPAVLRELVPVFKEHGVKRVLDLGCGTGNGALLLYEAGFSVRAMDLSPDMLSRAKDKALEKNYRIDFYQGDMRDFSLGRRFDAVVSLTDGFNYLLGEDQIRQALGRIKAHLNPGGWLFFDMSTLYKFKEVIGDRTFAENSEDNAYIWENNYREQDQTLAFLITVFQREKEDLYRRFEEYHEQRGYPAAVIGGLLEEEGFEVVRIRGRAKSIDVSERVFFLARLKIVEEAKGWD